MSSFAPPFSSQSACSTRALGMLRHRYFLSERLLVRILPA